jgi:hypothetical protein
MSVTIKCVDVEYCLADTHTRARARVINTKYRKFNIVTLYFALLEHLIYMYIYIYIYIYIYMYIYKQRGNILYRIVTSVSLLLRNCKLMQPLLINIELSKLGYWISLDLSENTPKIFRRSAVA